VGGAAHTVTVQRKLRPLRLAFLLRPDDRATLRKIFEINTCTWGGTFNGIIPVFKRRPPWWEDRLLRPPSATAIVRGYLDAFEPDYVVTENAELTEGLELDKNHVVLLSGILSADRGEPIRLGLSVSDLYRDLYKREFQFVRRTPLQVICPVVSGAPRLSLFSAMCFGTFPVAKRLAYFKRRYMDVFDAKDFRVDGRNLFDVLAGKMGTPLRVGSWGLAVQQHGWRPGPSLFFMDATRPIDLIDFWNLRALGWSILPVPRQWSEALVEPCRRFVTANNVPYPNNPQMKYWTTLLRSRTTPEEDVKAFARRISVPGERSLSLQTWYPRLWDEWARDKDYVERCDISVESADVKCVVQNNFVVFESLSPQFADQFSLSSGSRWANVIQIRDYRPGSEMALALPPGVREIERSLGMTSRDSMSVTAEGIVLRCQHTKLRHFLRLPDPLAVFRAWFANHGFKVELSGAGRVATQLIRTIGGVWGAGVIACPDLLRLLDKMAHGSVEFPADDNGSKSGKPRVRGRSVSWRRWWDLLQKANKGNADRARLHLDSLTQRGVLKMGIQLKCPQCGQTNWYPLDKMADQLQCERCLQMFPFPAAQPPQDAWHYRTQGASNVENYAQGGYAVALALRFLTVTRDAEATWVPNIEITDAAGNTQELDFAMWRREAHVRIPDLRLLLGECKSFNQFLSRDLKRATFLSERFPGATLVFATLRPELDRNEKSRLAKLARRGRKELRAEKWRTPVLILTSRELMSDMRPPYCWQEAGGKLAQFAANYRGYGGLDELCDATQQLHLDMEPYGQWREAEFAKRRQRFARARVKRGPMIGKGKKGS